MHKLIHKILRITVLVLIVLLAMEIIGIKISPVMGPSMFPTVQNGDMVIDINPWFGIDRSDLAVVLMDKNYYLIKRVIGVPGDQIILYNHYVIINGKILYEPYLYTEFTYEPLKIELDNNSYFLLGDNRFMSYDSRDFGPIHKDQIIGKVIAVLD